MALTSPPQGSERKVGTFSRYYGGLLSPLEGGKVDEGPLNPVG